MTKSLLQLAICPFLGFSTGSILIYHSDLTVELIFIITMLVIFASFMALEVGIKE